MEILEMKASLLEKHDRDCVEDALVDEIFNLLQMLSTVQRKSLDLENRVRFLEYMNPSKEYTTESSKLPCSQPVHHKP